MRFPRNSIILVFVGLIIPLKAKEFRSCWPCRSEATHPGMQHVTSTAWWKCTHATGYVAHCWRQVTKRHHSAAQFNCSIAFFSSEFTFLRIWICGNSSDLIYVLINIQQPTELNGSIEKQVCMLVQVVCVGEMSTHLLPHYPFPLSSGDVEVSHRRHVCIHTIHQLRGASWWAKILGLYPGDFRL